jgi:hypothetical protein
MGTPGNGPLALLEQADKATQLAMTKPLATDNRW